MAARRRWLGWSVLLSLAAFAATRVRRAVARARDVPLSPLTAGRRVGADYPEREGIVAEGTVAGEMDDLRAFARPDFDPDAVAPEVREFYERTADYDLAYETEWHHPFRVGAALAGRVTSRVEQLNLPGPRESGVRSIESRFVPVDPTADPRDGARAWVRTTDGGDAVFVAIYAHHERDRTRYVNIAVPLPGANLSTVLRPEVLETPDGEGNAGLELTTLAGDDGNGGGDDSDGDEGLYLVTPVGALDLPLDQRFRVRPAGTADSDSLAGAGASAEAVAGESGDCGSVAATHEMWLFGHRFLTVRYAGRERT